MCSKIASACWRPLSRYARMSKDGNNNNNKDESSLGGGNNNNNNDKDESSLEGGENDGMLWSRDLEKHSCGEFSYAVVQANQVIEDHSQVETGHFATFVGVYDGHGGPEASRFISDHLFLHLMKLAKESGTISEGVLRDAISETEDNFLSFVRRAFAIKPLIASIGSCCLVGVIWRGTLYVANLGDSRAVLGSVGRSKKIVAEQLTRDHNASIEDVRQELRSLHPDDSRIVVMKNGVWRIKGIIQVSRSIGDAYLKRPEFSLDPSFPKFHLNEPIHRPVLRADPSISTRVLQPNDKFIIFASDGLWELLSNQEAVEIVHNNPRAGIARMLLKSAMTKAAKKGKISYDDLKKFEDGNRRFYHDDISVVVIFIDHQMLENKVSVPATLSVRGFVDTAGPSKLEILKGLM